MLVCNNSETLKNNKLNTPPQGGGEEREQYFTEIMSKINTLHDGRFIHAQG